MDEVRRERPRTEDSPMAQLEVAVPAALLDQARELGLDVAQAAADGVRRAVMAERAKRYTEENREALDGWAEYLRENGHPFEDIMHRII